MTIISLINVKGGVGKTATAINLAGAIADQKHKVLLIDNDSQSSLSQILNIKNKFTMYDLYSNSKVEFSDCIAKYNEYIHVIPNTIESSVLERELYNKKCPEHILKSKYKNFSHDYDFIIIDNSPFLGMMVQNSLCMSNYYMEIIDNSPSALQGLNMVSKIVNELKENLLIEDLKLIGILRNRFEKRTVFSRQFTEVTEEALKDDLFSAIIYDSVKYKEATAMNKTIQEYSNKHAKAYTELYYEILDRVK
ncbi:ParA family protein [Clostridium estertheticum]|uniref:ParA family protein n=1 Tax=Clostridium estertheticum TaxID=238834 RepID=UPI001CF16ED8|nr:ParA family protein [Clostridium estertheticum]MCB2361978.1 ParA family protein [Clostridium estertheticum]